MEEYSWRDADYPEEIIFDESQQLKKLKISEEAWTKSQEVLSEDATGDDLINFLRMDDDTEEVLINDTM